MQVLYSDFRHKQYNILMQLISGQGKFMLHNILNLSSFFTIIILPFRDAMEYLNFDLSFFLYWRGAEKSIYDIATTLLYLVSVKWIPLRLALAND